MKVELTLQLIGKSSHCQTVEQGAELGTARKSLVTTEVREVLNHIIDEMHHTVRSVQIAHVAIDVSSLDDVSLDYK